MKTAIEHNRICRAILAARLAGDDDLSWDMVAELPEAEDREVVTDGALNLAVQFIKVMGGTEAALDLLQRYSAGSETPEGQAILAEVDQEEPS